MSKNTGDWSTGYWSTGDWSTGDRSTGDWSTGDWSTGHRSTGHFSTVDYSGFGCFDAPCTVKEWNAAAKPDCLYFNLTEWVIAEDMTDKEKEDNPDYNTTGGYLKTYDYKAAFTASMKKATPEEIEQVKALPNFDAQKFFEISGFMIKDTVTITIEGKDIEISKEEFESIKAQFLE